VTIPEGDPIQGKSIFDDNCAACHALSVRLYIHFLRVMIKGQQDQDLEDYLEGQQAAQVFQPVKP
jgi:mono/diheme cytochrome c family protein